MRFAPRLLGLVALWVGVRMAASAQSASPADLAKSPSAAAIAAGRARAVEFAAALLAETNRVRREHGRKPLRPRVELDAAADDQAAFMVLTFTAQHTSPIRGQETAGDRVRRRGLEVALVAENVASLPVGEGETPPPVKEIAARLVAQWLASPGHRANLLRTEATHLGGAVRLARVRELWCAFGVQVFSTTPLRGTRGEALP